MLQAQAPGRSFPEVPRGQVAAHGLLRGVEEPFLKRPRDLATRSGD